MTQWRLEAPTADAAAATAAAAQLEASEAKAAREGGDVQRLLFLLRRPLSEWGAHAESALRSGVARAMHVHSAAVEVADAREGDFEDETVLVTVNVRSRHLQARPEPPPPRSGCGCAAPAYPTRRDAEALAVPVKSGRRSPPKADAAARQKLTPQPPLQAATDRLEAELRLQGSRLRTAARVDEAYLSPEVYDLIRQGAARARAAGEAPAAVAAGLVTDAALLKPYTASIFPPTDLEWQPPGTQQGKPGGAGGCAGDAGDASSPAPAVVADADPGAGAAETARARAHARAALGGAPQAALDLVHVHGFAGHRTVGALLLARGGDLVYPAARVLVVRPAAEPAGADGGQQAFFRAHRGDVTCLALHPGGAIVASGDAASAPGAADARPGAVLVWDTRTLETLVALPLDGFAPDSGRKGAAPSLEAAAAGTVYALAFSPGGEKLVVVTAREQPAVQVWDWRARRRCSVALGDTRCILAARADPHQDRAPDAFSFVTCGVGHLKLWSFRNDRLQAVSWTGDPRGRAKPSTLLCAAFPAKGLLVAGTHAGALLLFRLTAAGPALLRAIDGAHGGPVFALCAAHAMFLSGGGDGSVSRWRVENKPGGMDLQYLKSFPLAGLAAVPAPVGGSRGASVKALACLEAPDETLLLVGTADGKIVQARSAPPHAFTHARARARTHSRARARALSPLTALCAGARPLERDAGDRPGPRGCGGGGGRRRARSDRSSAAPHGPRAVSLRWNGRRGATLGRARTARRCGAGARGSGFCARDPACAGRVVLRRRRA